MDHGRGEKRKRLGHEQHTSPRRRNSPYDREHRNNAGPRGWSVSEQARINKIQEEERHRGFLAKEGQFVLQQKRKAAEIRIKENRAQPIDRLAVNLRFIDPLEDLINEDTEDTQLDFVNPENVIDDVSREQLAKLGQEIANFLDIEQNPSSQEYWRTVRVLLREKEKSSEAKAVRSVSSDIDNLLRPKSYEELQKLERQIDRKLSSDEPIDTDYWQQLLNRLLVYKAKAKLKKLSRDVLNSKLQSRRQSNASIAQGIKTRLSTISSRGTTSYLKAYDPDPLVELSVADKTLQILDERSFLANITFERQEMIRTGHIAFQISRPEDPQAEKTSKIGIESKKSTSLFEKEAAKGMEEDEELFAGEEHVESESAHLWKGKYRPRKPRYFNRVQMGYEWNKYNQTHYDHDNPPPKVVQGYKFHVFYPDLIDPTKAPTYRISREGGRKKGETLAPAGEEDTCIIRFTSGPPYEDIAFRIVDRDWDYSARHDRGFKSTFEKGILTLHFSFKKIYYRK